MMTTEKQQFGRGYQTENSIDPVVGFDYALLDSDTSAFLKQKTGEIRDEIGNSISHLVKVGNDLIVVKERLEHGQWLRWLDFEFGWGDQTARNYMSLAQAAVQIPNYLEFGATALYLLTQKSTPEAAVNEVVERAAAGEKLTVDGIKAIIKENKPEQKPRQKPKTEPTRYTGNDDDFVPEEGDTFRDDVPAVDLESTSDNTRRPVSPLPYAAHRPFHTPIARPEGAALIQPGQASNGHGEPPRRAPELRRGGCYAADASGNIIDTNDGSVLSPSEIVTRLNAKPVTVSTPAPEPTLELVSASLGIDKADMIELASDHTPKVITLLARAVEAMPEQPENPLELLTTLTIKLQAAKKVKAGKKPAEKTASNHKALFGAIRDVFHYSANMTAAEKSRVGKVAKELSAVGADVLDIGGLFKYCQRQYDKFTENAFLTNWSAYRASDFHLKAHTRLVPDVTPVQERERPIQDFELEAIPATGEERAKRAEEIFQQVLALKSVRSQQQAS